MKALNWLNRIYMIGNPVVEGLLDTSLEEIDSYGWCIPSYFLTFLIGLELLSGLTGGQTITLGLSKYWLVLVMGVLDLVCMALGYKVILRSMIILRQKEEVK